MSSDPVSSPLIQPSFPGTPPAAAPLSSDDLPDWQEIWRYANHPELLREGAVDPKTVDKIRRELIKAGYPICATGAIDDALIDTIIDALKQLGSGPEHIDAFKKAHPAALCAAPTVNLGLGDGIAPGEAAKARAAAALQSINDLFKPMAEAEAERVEDFLGLSQWAMTADLAIQLETSAKAAAENVDKWHESALKQMQKFSPDAAPDEALDAGLAVGKIARLRTKCKEALAKISQRVALLSVAEPILQSDALLEAEKAKLSEAQAEFKVYAESIQGIDTLLNQRNPTNDEVEEFTRITAGDSEPVTKLGEINAAADAQFNYLDGRAKALDAFLKEGKIGQGTLQAAVAEVKKWRALATEAEALKKSSKKAVDKAASLQKELLGWNKG